MNIQIENCPFFPNLQFHYKRVRNLCPLSIVIFAGSLGCFYPQKKKVTDHCFAESRSQVQTHSLRAVPAHEPVLF